MVLGRVPLALHLIHYAEIKDFAQDGTWKTDSIESRHKTIIDFAVRKWSYSTIDIKYLEKELESTI